MAKVPETPAGKSDEQLTSTAPNAGLVPPARLAEQKFLAGRSDPSMDPKDLGERYDLAKQSGLDYGVVKNLPKADLADLPDFDRLARERPKLVRYLSESTENAIIGTPHYRSLELLEDLTKDYHRRRAQTRPERNLGYFTELGRSYSRGQDIVDLGYYGFHKHLFALSYDLPGAYDAQIEEIKKRQQFDAAYADPYGWSWNPAESFAHITTSAAEIIPQYLFTFERGWKYGVPVAIAQGAAGAAAGSAAGGAGAVPGFAIGAAKGFLGGVLSFGAAESAFITEAGHMAVELDELRDENGNSLNPQVIRVLSIFGGAIAAALEYAAFRTFLKVIPGADKILGFTKAKKAPLSMIKRAALDKTLRPRLIAAGKKMATAAITEGVTEGLQEMIAICVTDLGEAWHEWENNVEIEEGSNDDRTMSEYWARVWEASDKGFSASLGLGFLPTVGRVSHALYAAREAQATNEYTERLQKAVDESPVKDISREKTVEFLQEVGAPDVDLPTAAIVELAASDPKIADALTNAGITQRVIDDAVASAAPFIPSNLANILVHLEGAARDDVRKAAYLRKSHLPLGDRTVEQVQEDIQRYQELDAETVARAEDITKEIRRLNREIDRAQPVPDYAATVTAVARRLSGVPERNGGDGLAWLRKLDVRRVAESVVTGDPIVEVDEEGGVVLESEKSAQEAPGAPQAAPEAQAVAEGGQQEIATEAAPKGGRPSISSLEALEPELAGRAAVQEAVSRGADLDTLRQGVARLREQVPTDEEVGGLDPAAVIDLLQTDPLREADAGVRQSLGARLTNSAQEANAVLDAMEAELAEPTDPVVKPRKVDGYDQRASTQIGDINLREETLYQQDADVTTGDQEADIFASVNKRIAKDLEWFEKLFGTLEEQQKLPQKTEKGKIVRKPSVKLYEFGQALHALKEDGTLARYIDYRVDPEALADERGLKGKAREAFMLELVQLRKGPELAFNSKAGISVDLSLATCHPTTQCAECYAASGMTHWSRVRSAMRNTVWMLADPKEFGRRIAEKVNKEDRTRYPFLRLLGSGDMTSTEAVEAFNEIAKHLDRNIHIFSRHHQNLAKLKHGPRAFFIKMGSVDADIMKRMSTRRLKSNLSKGIVNAFLYTDDSQIQLLRKLMDNGALGLILSADKKLHAQLPKDLRLISCPCDAGERTHHASCRDCALHQDGCFMAFADKAVDDKGRLHRIDMTSELPMDARPVMDLFADYTPKGERKKLMQTGATPHGLAAMAVVDFVARENIIEVMEYGLPKFLTPAERAAWYNREHVEDIERGTTKPKTEKSYKSKKEFDVGITIRDVRWPDSKVRFIDKDLWAERQREKGLDDTIPESTPSTRYVTRDEVIANVQAFVEFQNGLRARMRNEGTFFHIGGEIQPAIAYKAWRAVDPDELTAEEKGQVFYQMENGDPEPTTDAEKKAVRYGRIRIADDKHFIEVFGHNLSTIFHELGHSFLSEIRDMVASGVAGQELLSDWATLQKWLGVDIDQGLTEEQHETFARALEQYFYEGKAPTTELLPIMQRVKNWIRAAYKNMLSSLTKFMSVPLNDEVRAIFDRWLMTEQEVQKQAFLAEADTFMEGELLDMGFDQEELGELRNMTRRILNELEIEVDDARDGKLKERMKGWKVEAEAAYDVRPEARCMRDIRSQGGLNLSILKSLTNRETIAKFRKMGLVAKQTEVGVDGEVIAAQHGYESFDAMVGALNAAPTKRDFVADYTRSRLAADDSTYDAAEALAESESYVEYLDTITEKLIARAGRKTLTTPDGKVFVYTPKGNFPAEIGKAMRAFAEKQMQAMPLREAIDTYKYVLQVQRLAREVRDAIKVKDYEKALNKNFQQRRSLELLRLSRNLRKEMDRTLRKANRAAKAKPQSGRAVIDEQYQKNIVALLHRFSLWQRKPVVVDPQRTSLANLLDPTGQTDLAMHPVFASWLVLSEQSTPYKDLTVERFRDMSNLLYWLDGTGRELATNWSETMKANRKEAAETLASQLDGLKDKWQVGDLAIIGSLVEGNRAWDLYARRPLYLMRMLDGGVNTNGQGTPGPFETMFFDRFSAAYEKTLRIHKKLNDGPFGRAMERLDRMTNETHHDLGVEVPRRLARKGFHWTTERILAVGFHMGNKHNRDAVLRGYGLQEGDLELITRKLTREDWQMIQDIWDGFDSLWDGMNNEHYKIHHFHAVRVSPDPFVVRIDGEDVQFRGGYCPLVFDFETDQKAKQMSATDEALNTHCAAWNRPSVHEGMMKSRKDSSGGLAPRLRTSIIAQHVDYATRYTAFAGLIRDLGSILSLHLDRTTEGDPVNIVTLLEQKGGRHMPTVVQEWIQYIARPTGDKSIVEKITRWLRSTSTVVALGLNVGTAFKQAYSAFGGAVDLGVFRHPIETITHLASGVTFCALHPLRAREFIFSRSEAMRERQGNFETAAGRAARRFADQTPKGLKRLFRARELGQAIVMAPIGFVDSLVVYPIWIAAYNQALSRGMTEQQASAEATKLISASQPFNRSIDKTGAQRAKGIASLVTMFSSFTSVFYSRNHAFTWKNAKAGNITWTEYIGRAVAERIVPPIMMVYIAQLLWGRTPADLDDEDERDRAWKEYLIDGLAYQFIGKPGLRELTGAAAHYVKTGFRRELTKSPAFAPIDAFARAGYRLADTMIEDGNEDQRRAKLLKDFVQMTSYATGLPFGRVYNSLTEGIRQFEDEAGTSLFNVVLPDPEKKQ